MNLSPQYNKSFIDLIRSRKSIREYKDKPVEPEKLDLIKEVVLRSPSSRNFQPWEFVFVTDKKKIALLSKSKEKGSDFLRSAPVCIVVCAERSMSDAWIEDCSIASIFAQLAAQSLGLGSCWIQIRNRMHNESISAEDYVKEILNIPDNLSVESIIAIGYPAEKKTPVSSNDLNRNKIHMESF